MEKKFKQSGNIKEIIDRVKINPLKVSTPNKKLLKKGWNRWKKLLIKRDA